MKRKKRTKKRINRKKRIISGVIIFILLICFLTAMLGFKAITTNISDYKYEPKGKTLIYSSDNVLISEIFDENRTYVDIQKVPKDLINAVVAVEDKKFYNHNGVSIRGIIRAFVNNVLSKDAYSEGGSTITQQVVKRLFLTDQKSYIRKLNEAILAMKMEKAFTKDEILEMYLNQMYLGSGTYGVEEASKKYFGKDVKDLNTAECALIAGLFQAPSAYCPFDNYDEAIKRQHEVIDAMVSSGYITKQKADEIKKAPIKLASNSRGFSGTSRENTAAFVDYVIDEYYTHIIPEFQKKYSMNYENAKLLAQKHLTYDGVTIKTTLSYSAQQDAVSSINSALKYYGLTKKATGAAVSVDYNTGQIRVYWGGNTQIDMASQPRQPGSSIKPLYYAAAIDDGVVTSRTMVNDVKTSWGGYTPKNYDGAYKGWISVRSALVGSRNIPSVKIFDEYGINRSMNAIKSYGFTTVKDTDYNLATALGGLTYGLKPVEMAKAYCAFANGGVVNEIYSIESISDKNGQEMFNIKNVKLSKTRVFDISTADTMNGLLHDVVSYGTGTAAHVYKYAAAGKTGTTEEKKDLWFAGYCGGLSTTIWIGAPDMKVVGGSSAYSAYAFGRYMNKVINDGALAKMVPNLSDIEASSTMVNVKVAKSSTLDQGRIYFNDSEVESIWISSSEYDTYADMIVKKVTIDSSTGRLFVEGTCPEQYKFTIYYLEKYAPTEYCTKSHYIDKIFDDIKNKGHNNKYN